MWQQWYDYARQLFRIKEQTEKNAADIREMQNEIKELSAALRAWVVATQRNFDNEAHEREKQVLRFENLLLRAGRQLPPPTGEDPAVIDDLREQIARLSKENEDLKRNLGLKDD